MSLWPFFLHEVKEAFVTAAKLPCLKVTLRSMLLSQGLASSTSPNRKMTADVGEWLRKAQVHTQSVVEASGCYPRNVRTRQRRARSACTDHMRLTHINPTPSSRWQDKVLLVPSSAGDHSKCLRSIDVAGSDHLFVCHMCDYDVEPPLAVHKESAGPTATAATAVSRSPAPGPPYPNPAPVAPSVLFFRTQGITGACKERFWSKLQLV